MRVLVTGSNGQLGSELKELMQAHKEFTFVGADLPKVDITNKNSLEAFVVKENIDSIINCAAYTAVDKAEQEATVAFAVNATAVENLVQICEKRDIRLVQISTDYVFDGTKNTPYTEKDSIAPMGVYGNSKRKGEEFVISSAADVIVIRTSWLYAAYGNNFVKTMMHLGNEREQLGVIFDQIGTPTYAHDLAKTCLDILLNTERIDCKGKVYHYSNEGVASWYDFTKAIMEITGIECTINPIETKDYPTPAKRPHYSVLNKAKIKADFGIEIPYWKDALVACLKRLASKNHTDSHKL